MLNEINDVAGQHEIILETYSGQIMKEISDLVRELKEERKKVSVPPYNRLLVAVLGSLLKKGATVFFNLLFL